MTIMGISANIWTTWTILQLTFDCGGRTSYFCRNLLEQARTRVTEQLSHAMCWRARVSLPSGTRIWRTTLTTCHRCFIRQFSGSWRLINTCCWAITAGTQPGVIWNRSRTMGMRGVPLALVVIGGTVPAIRQARRVHWSEYLAFPLYSVK